MFQKAEDNNMKAKYCYLFNKRSRLSWKTKPLGGNSLRSCEMPDPCNRRPAITCDDVYTRMSWLLDLFINTHTGTYTLFDESSLIHCTVIQNSTFGEAFLQMARITASSNEKYRLI